MIGLSYEEFVQIYKAKFDLGPYTDDCLKYYKDGAFLTHDEQTGEEVNIPDDVKSVFFALRLASEIDIGKQLFEELDPNIKIKFFVDKKAKEEEINGYSTSNHEVALADANEYVGKNAVTILHEVTHQIQRQKGCSCDFLATQEDRCVVNMMQEVDAKVNGYIAKHQILRLLLEEGGYSEQKKMLSSINSSDFPVLNKYADLILWGKSEKEILNCLVAAIHLDVKNIYSEQFLNYANYKSSLEVYLAKAGILTEDKVKEYYKKKFMLDDESFDEYFGVHALPKCVRKRVKKKIEEVAHQGNVANKYTYDGKKLVCICDYVGERLISVERFIDKSSILKKYDKDGNISGMEIMVDYGDNKCERSIFDRNGALVERVGYKDGKKTFEIKDRDSFRIKYDDGNEQIICKNYREDGYFCQEIIKSGGDSYRIIWEQDDIVKITNLEGVEIADAKVINQEMKLATRVFQNIKADVSDEDLKRAYEFVRDNKFMIYEKGTIVYNIIFEEAKKRGLLEDAVENRKERVVPEKIKRFLRKIKRER